MERHELSQLEAHIQALKTTHAILADSATTDELWKMIHNPGWTTVAERILVTNSLEYIVAQAKLLNNLQQGLLLGARAVGKTQAAGA
jgi:hypothetical protein